MLKQSAYSYWFSTENTNFKHTKNKTLANFVKDVGSLSVPYKPADKLRHLTWFYICYNPLQLISKCNLFQKCQIFLMKSTVNGLFRGATKLSRKNRNSWLFFSHSDKKTTLTLLNQETALSIKLSKSSLYFTNWVIQGQIFKCKISKFKQPEVKIWPHVPLVLPHGWFVTKVRPIKQMQLFFRICHYFLFFFHMYDLYNNATFESVFRVIGFDINFPIGGVIIVYHLTVL